ncbi:RNA-binding protein [Methanomassiliicoccales archaeon RumEn M1]|jgi:exosome complex component CSL4|nr:RNA-binding protein [Methanomassiliicoccales archaeon RumEn M1]
MTKRTVVPGEEVAVAEEYMPDMGTYEHDGKIISALAGELELDKDKMLAKVSAVNPMNLLKVGDSVFCRVTDVRAAMAICEIVATEGSKRGITGETSATIHISKLSSEYVQEVGKEMRPNDLVRAKVIQTTPSVQLSTQEPHFGVVKALCRKCRSPMVCQGKSLRCEPCERVESRKLADDYGDVDF